MHSEKSPQDMTLRSWLALFILALSTFTIVTTELAPVGLLTPIAEGLRASESAVGMTVSLYAWVGALSALFASVFLGNVAKKRLLLTLTVILFLSNVLAATVNTYAILLAARVLGALAHGAFWAMIGATAVAIVPARFWARQLLSFLVAFLQPAYLACRYQIILVYTSAGDRRSG